MEFTKISSDRIGDSYYKMLHPSGLTIYVYPKKSYNSTYAIFGTNFGSIDTTFMYKGEKIVVPDGIAHYLEHKLFESEDGDAFAKYAKTGAMANAYTSFDKTFLKRCRAYDNNGKEFDIEMNFKLLDKNRFISDGDKDIITIPEGSRDKLIETDKKIITYEED